MPDDNNLAAPPAAAAAVDAAATVAIAARVTDASADPDRENDAPQSENLAMAALNSDGPSTRAVVVSGAAPIAGSLRASSSRESVSSVLTGLSFAVNAARLVAEGAFATAKASTSLGIGIARGIVDGVGSQTGGAGGIAPLVSGTLTLAERLAHLGMDVGRFWTRFGLDAASVSLSSADHLFGSTDTARALHEFAALVQAEIAREIDLSEDGGDIGVDDDQAPVAVLLLEDVGEGGLTSESAERARQSLANIGFVDTVRALVAWMCLMRLTRASYERRALAACTAILQAPEQADASSQSGDLHIVELESEEVSLDEIVFEQLPADADSEHSDLVIAHIGQAEVGPTTSHHAEDDGSADNVQQLLARLRRNMTFASGAYGQTAVKFLFGGEPITLGDLLSQDPGDGGVTRNHSFFARYAEVGLNDVFHTSGHNRARRNAPGANDGGGDNDQLIAPLDRLAALLLPEDRANYQPTFYVILDHRHRSVVVALRGTLSLHDTLVDLTCRAIEVDVGGGGEPHLVHAGIYAAALRVALPAAEWRRQFAQQHATTAPTPLGAMPLAAAARSPGVFEAVRAALRAHPRYDLVLTGHSLGAGVAALLSVLWGDPATGCVAARSGLLPPAPDGGDGLARVPLHCYAFACPAVLAVPSGGGGGGGGDGGADGAASTSSTRWAPGFERLVTSLVVGDDLVPRLSLGSVRDLAGAVAWLHLHRDDVANPLVAAGLGGSSPADLDPDAVLDRIRRTCFRAEKLYPAGRVLWITEDGVSGRRVVREVLRPHEGVLDGMVF
ncbi:hypothetical protein HK405_011830, partial [Cladochytrium tenue]